MTSPLPHLPLSERAAVRSQIRRASKLPRYPLSHGMETLSVDALSGTISLRYRNPPFLLLNAAGSPDTKISPLGSDFIADLTMYFDWTHESL